MTTKNIPDKTEVFEFQKQLLMKSLEIRNNTIINFDTQIANMKGWCIVVWLACIGWAITTEHNAMLYLPFLVPFLFWFATASVKQFQRGYVFTANYYSKYLGKNNKIEEMVTNKTFFDLPAFDINGYYTLRKKEETICNYKSATSFFKSFFIKEVSIFYIVMIVLNLCFFVIKYGN